MTLVDTVAWSAALRRTKGPRGESEQRVVDQLNAIISSGEAVLIGPVRQELLSGLREVSQFDRLRRMIEPYELLALSAATYDRAAQFFNSCRRVGIAAGDVDMLVCSAAVEHALPILTLDNDFPRYATVLPIALA